MKQDPPLLDDRPSFQQMFSDIKEYPCDLVIVHKLDRFSRDRYDSAFYRKGSSKNAGFVSCPFWKISTAARRASSWNPFWKECLNTIPAIWPENVQKEKKKLHINACITAESLPSATKSMDPGDTHVDPIESKWIIKAYEMKASGRSYMEIAAYLNGIGARTRRGQGFTKTASMIFSRMKSTRAFMYITGQLRRHPESGTII